MRAIAVKVINSASCVHNQDAAGKIWR